jgi:hypothetical protein
MIGIFVKGELLCVDLNCFLKGWDACVSEINTSKTFHELVVGRQGVGQAELEGAR